VARPALSETAIAAFRERLVELALRRFAEDGYGAVTLRGLARQLGVSHAMMYRYVADKDDLFAAVRLRSVERFVAYQEARLQPIADPRQALLEGARSYVDFAVEEPDAFRVMFDLSQPHLDAYPELERAHRRAFQILEKIVRRAIAAGVLAGEPGTVTQQLWAATHGIATLALTGRLRARRGTRELVDSLAQVLLNGLAPRRRSR
jgi:AcrR family transcriptional regulator